MHVEWLERHLLLYIMKHDALLYWIELVSHDDDHLFESSLIEWLIIRAIALFQPCFELFDDVKSGGLGLFGTSERERMLRLLNRQSPQDWLLDLRTATDTAKIPSEGGFKEWCSNVDEEIQIAIKKWSDAIAHSVTTTRVKANNVFDPDRKRSMWHMHVLKQQQANA